MTGSAFRKRNGIKDITDMKMEDLLKQINEICKTCIKCDPCCTGYMIKKKLENQKAGLRAA
jgi:hypothetical protein